MAIVVPILAGCGLLLSVLSIYDKHERILKTYEADCNAKLKVLHDENMQLKQRLREQEDTVTGIGITAAAITGMAVIGPAVVKAFKEMR